MRKTEYYDFLLETRMAKATGKRMLFTGPDYIGDYRVRFVDFTRYIGNSTASPESTSELKYLYRAAPRSPAPLQKDCYVGGIGWGVPKYSSLNRRVLVNGNQIKRKEFWQACEDRLTHRYQNPWQPPPDILDVEGQRARSTLAWTHDQYDDYCHGKSKWSQQFWNKNIPDATPVNMFQNPSAGPPLKTALYVLEGQQLENTKVEWDLGVMIADDLKDETTNQMPLPCEEME